MQKEKLIWFFIGLLLSANILIVPFHLQVSRWNLQLSSQLETLEKEIAQQQALLKKMIDRQDPIQQTYYRKDDFEYGSEWRSYLYMDTKKPLNSYQKSLQAFEKNLELRLHCKLLKKVGGLANGDGEWTICLDPIPDRDFESVRPSFDLPLSPEQIISVETDFLGDPTEKPRCLVYSFGINYDWSFDEEMLYYGCEVHSFDPSFKEFSLPWSDSYFDSEPKKNYDEEPLDTIPLQQQEWLDRDLLKVKGSEWRKAKYGVEEDRYDALDGFEYYEGLYPSKGDRRLKELNPKLESSELKTPSTENEDPTLTPNPTPTAKPPLVDENAKQDGPTIYFHPIGLAEVDLDGEIQYSGQRWNVRKLQTIMKLLGHHSIDFLKIDIEENEWPVFGHLIESNFFEKFPVSQLMIEIHISKADGDQELLDAYNSVLTSIEKSFHFELFYVHVNPLGSRLWKDHTLGLPCCYELSYVQPYNLWNREHKHLHHKIRAKNITTKWLSQPILLNYGGD